jgi:hypothetical protein
MKLHQHPDFRDAIIAAGKYFEPKGIANQLIEKDYYVTEALRTIANRWESQVIFKGGTSLWGEMSNCTETYAKAETLTV